MKIALIIISIFFIGGINAQTQITSDTVYGNWQVSNSPYIINNDIVIPKNAALFIQNGVEVYFANGCMMHVEGTIRAIGTPTDSIIFSVIDTSGYSNDISSNGGWGGMRFFNAGDSVIAAFGYCRFSYGKTLIQNDTLGNGGAIYVNNYPSIIFDNCEFVNNKAILKGGAIYYTNNCNITIKNSIIWHNIALYNGGGIATESQTTSLIYGNKIIYNTSGPTGGNNGGGSGGGIYVSIFNGNANQHPTIMNNFICNNKSGFGGGVYDSSIRTSIIGNIICNNSSYGIVNGHQLSLSKYINNTICNNGEIEDNNYYINEDGGIWSFSLGIKVKNNIIRGNGTLKTYGFVSSNIKLGNPYTTIKMHYIDYNNIEGLYDGDFNFDEDALFVNPTTTVGVTEDALSANWSLSNNSTSINVGNNDTTYQLANVDVYNNPRYYGNALDLGAAENQNVIMSYKSLEDASIEIITYPNPATDILNLRLINSSKNFKYQLFNMEGKLLSNGTLVNGNNQIIIKDLQPGIYFISVNGNEKFERIKFIKY